MKTAVSLPEDVFESAERLARRARKSRSALYSEAIREYVARHSPDDVTAALDGVADSGPGFRRPVVVVQGDSFNRSKIATVVCVPLTSNLKWADAPGNALLEPGHTGLPKNSVANVTRAIAVDKSLLTERAGRLSRSKTNLVLSGIDVLLGR